MKNRLSKQRARSGISIDARCGDVSFADSRRPPWRAAISICYANRLARQPYAANALALPANADGEATAEAAG